MFLFKFLSKGKGELTNQILLARREPLRPLQVAEELLGIAAPAVGSALGNEAKHLHAPIVADPQLPVLAVDVDGPAVLANRVHVAEAGQPIHNSCQHTYMYVKRQTWVHHRQKE